MRRRVLAATIGVTIVVVVAVGVWRWLDEPEASCGTEAGPSAVVAFDGDGNPRWTRLVGGSADVTVDRDGVIAVESVEIAATLDAATGHTMACHDLDSSLRDQPAQATTSLRSPPGAPAVDEVAFVEELASDDWRVFRGISSKSTGGQRMHLAVETVDGAPLWDGSVPGFVVEAAGDQLLTIDQTNGTGNFDQGARFPTLLTAYDIRTGEPEWSTTIPGTPHEVVRAGAVIAIPGHGILHGVDPETGSIIWEAALGNPGRTRHYSEGGGVSRLVYDETTDTIVAVVVARPEYRD